MDHGLEGVIFDGEKDLAGHSCPLVLGLTTCLHEALPGSGAVPHLQQALVDLGASSATRLVSIAARRSSPAALAAYLEFLMPELRMRSPRAAVSVRWAVDALRGTVTGADIRIQ